MYADNDEEEGEESVCVCDADVAGWEVNAALSTAMPEEAEEVESAATSDDDEDEEGESDAADMVRSPSASRSSSCRATLNDVHTQLKSANTA
jgi:hypothetical protein